MILAINTATESVSIALYQPRKIQPRRLDLVLDKEISWESYRTQSKELLPKIDKMLKESKVKLSDLTAIAVFQGPGSYTGLRVGISVANTLAWSLNIPVIGIQIQKFQPTADHPQGEKIKNKISKFSKIIIPKYDSRL